MSFYGIFVSSIIICAISLAYAMSENAQVQGSLSSAYSSLAANIRLQSLNQIIGNMGTENSNMQNIAQLNNAKLYCYASQCTMQTAFGYLLIKN